jgi:hypothetical protein
MKRIIYLSLLFAIPFLASAEHRRSYLNGKWINPYHGQQIKLKVKHNRIRVKNLASRGWETFRIQNNGLFVDKFGNTIRIRNIHELTFRSNYGRERIRFVKKEHVLHNHQCGPRCSIDGSFYIDELNDVYRYDRNNRSNDYYSNSRRSERDIIRPNRGIRGRYFIRELDEYVTLEDTRDGLRARRGNQDWINYKQNRNRKNEFLDRNGNKYRLKSDGRIVWKNRSETVTLNLSK